MTHSPVKRILCNEQRKLCERYAKSYTVKCIAVEPKILECDQTIPLLYKKSYDQRTPLLGIGHLLEEQRLHI